MLARANSGGGGGGHFCKKGITMPATAGAKQFYSTTDNSTGESFTPKSVMVASGFNYQGTPYNVYFMANSDKNIAQWGNKTTDTGAYSENASTSNYAIEIADGDFNLLVSGAYTNKSAYIMACD